MHVPRWSGRAVRPRTAPVPVRRLGGALSLRRCGLALARRERFPVGILKARSPFMRSGHRESWQCYLRTLSGTSGAIRSAAGPHSRGSGHLCTFFRHRKMPGRYREPSCRWKLTQQMCNERALRSVPPPVRPNSARGRRYRRCERPLSVECWDAPRCAFCRSDPGEPQSCHPRNARTPPESDV